MSFNPPRSGKPLALAVDDDFSLRLAMSAALTKAGFEVIEAENGQQAVDYFHSHKPDLICLDVMMPVMDGFETCATLRSLPGGDYTQILMVTGLDDTDSIEQAFEVGANDFIAKPINWVMMGHRAKYMMRAGYAFQELDRSKRRLAKTQELAKIGNWEIDLVEDNFLCSQEARSLLGLPGDRPVSYKDFLAPVIAQEYGKVKETIDAAVKSKRSFSVNYRAILPNGTQRHILNRGEIYYDELGVARVMLGAVQDVSQLKDAEEEIRLLAFYDGLTGLANRMLFLDRLDQEIATAKRQKQIFALLFLDLDQFKRVNDTLGHHVGDLLLKSVAETLHKCIRASDTASRPLNSDADTLIARLGGDEFIILLSDIDKPENASVVARRILQELPKPFNLAGNEVSVTTSIGICTYPADGIAGEVLLKNADSAMYHAKEKGRNNYQFYREDLNTKAIERFSLEHDLRKGLEKGEFHLYYQPQVDLVTRKIVGAEALIRWLHPIKGMIHPESFIPLAEETGTIIDINKWVVQTACKQNDIWQQDGLEPVRIAVNLSGYRFASQNIIKVIQDALDEAGLEATNLEVEITENVLMQDTVDTIGILNQLKDLKLRIALDDFGTGYSSLSYLTSFPVDIIKIDRSFVMGCTMHQNNRVIIKTIIAMGHSLGMKIVAEGIETEEQYEVIKGYGADEAQGYFFSPPVPQDDFFRMLKDGGSL